jgi:serine/threonine protein kinase
VPDNIEDTIIKPVDEIDSQSLAEGGASQKDFKVPSSKARELIGKTIARYEIVSLVGQGGMGVVYKAKHALLKKTVAVKMLHPHLADNIDSMNRFKQEAEAASRLEHPNVAAVHDFGVTEDGKPYIIMDFVSGQLLQDALAQGQMALPRIIHIFTQVCDALDHAHRKGVVHRDLKPSNIILVQSDDDPDFVKIVDFGIAKVLSDEVGKTMTQTGEALGSPLYMSPEQCLGQKLDARSDIYAVGCLLYEAISGKTAVVGDSIFEIMYKQLHEMPTGLKSLRQDLGNIDQLEAIVFKAMAKNAKERYHTMVQLKDAINLAAGGERSPWQICKDKLEVLRLKLLPQRKSLAYKGTVAAVILTLLLATGGLMYKLYAPPDVPLSSLSLPLFAPFRQIERKPYGSETEIRSFLTNSAIGSAKDAFGEYTQSHIERLEEQKKQLFSRGRYEEAIPVVQELIDSVDAKQMSGEVKAGIVAPLYFHLGECFYAQKGYEKASQAYAKTVHTLGTTFGFPPDKREIGVPRSRLADTYYYRHDFENAYKYYHDALPFWNEDEGGRAQLEDAALFFSKYGDTAYRLRRYDIAEDAFKKAQDMWSRLAGGDEKKLKSAQGMVALGRALSAAELMTVTADGALKAKYIHNAKIEFERAKSLLSSADPDGSPLAIALKYEADFLWKDGDYWDAFMDNWRANSILAKLHA